MGKFLVVGVLSFFLQFQSCGSQVIARPQQDFCTGATGPRPITDIASPGTTVDASIDDVNGGFCGVEINTPGIWWWVNGTGSIIRASSCDRRTQIKTKLSIFTGSCGELRCITGSELPDYDCPLLQRGENGEWGTTSTAIDFPTLLGKAYYILVQQSNPTSAGAVWMSFRAPDLPANDKCIDAVGPVPRDLTKIDGTTNSGAVSDVQAGFCGAPALYPGVWYQVMGTGGSVTVMACSEFNFDGFYFSVYNGAYCDGMSCVAGSYDVNVLDEEKCSFGAASASRPLTKYTFDTTDRDRYFIYVHYARTTVDKPTSDFRLWMDDGQQGKAGSGASTGIKFEASSTASDGNGNGNGNGNGSNNGGGNNNGNGNSGAVSTGLRVALGLAFATLSVFL